MNIEIDIEKTAEGSGLLPYVWSVIVDYGEMIYGYNETKEQAYKDAIEYLNEAVLCNALNAAEQ